MRSVHLERDILDPVSSQGYILTTVAEQAIRRIQTGFVPGSTQRAWRIAGDYGSGKTDLGLTLARIAIGAKDQLPKAVRRLIGECRLQPLIATGDNEPLGATVMRALGADVPLGTRGEIQTKEVIESISKAVAAARRRQFSGIIVILDELGKNLEYAARNPDSDDIFLLQRLAEEAARSGDKPFIIIAMLHQGVAAYASGLDSAGRREWDKVSGRFEEIVFAQPVEQAAALMAATLNVDVDKIPSVLRRESESAMRAALGSGLYGLSAAESLGALGPHLFPIHPTLLPVLAKTMRRFGQNERSLFSFVSSAEPMGLQDHAGRKLADAGHYRIHHFFEYVRNNLLPTLNAGSAHTRWGVIEAVLGAASTRTPEEESVLKTVAMLSLLDSPDLAATETLVIEAVGGDTSKITKAIHRLRKTGVLYERGTVRGLCLWPHTSISVDEAFGKAKEATALGDDAVAQLCVYTQSEPLVPRGYYVRTGTLRYAVVQLIPATSLDDLLKNQPTLSGKGADLHLRIVLPVDKNQEVRARRKLRDISSQLADGLMIAVAEPRGTALGALADVLAWEWVKKNTPQLSGDRFAREEVSRQIEHARRNLRARLGGLDNLAVGGGPRMQWFSGSTVGTLSTGRELLGFLDKECSRIYSAMPLVRNELVNRRTPSSAAVAARGKLAEALATAPEKKNLGMDDTKRPAEMALYLSVLKFGGFHVEVPGRGWTVQLPATEQDKCNLLPSIELISDILKAEGTDAMVPVPTIFDALSRPPYGVREGLQPLVLAIYLASHHQRVALYEDETYLDTVGGEVFLRLMKEPQFFHLQWCGLEGVRSEVFVKLLELLQFSPRDASRTDLIDLVRPLAVFIARGVPDYCRKTSSLSAMAVAVRSALLDSREPVRLIFTILPQACGLLPIVEKGMCDPSELASRLRISLHEIRMAYPRLLERLGASLCAAFDVAKEIPEGRRSIAGRAAQLAAVVTEPSLKSFALRLADSALDDRAWIESVANLLARKSAERWGNNDETEFHYQLEIAAAHFRRVEKALIGTTRRLNGHACRIELTKSDGTEVGELVNWDGLEEARIQPIQDEIHKILMHHGRHGLAAALRAIWNRLDNEPKFQKD